MWALNLMRLGPFVHDVPSLRLFWVGYPTRRWMRILSPKAGQQSGGDLSVLAGRGRPQKKHHGEKGPAGVGTWCDVQRRSLMPTSMTEIAYRLRLRVRTISFYSHRFRAWLPMKWINGPWKYHVSLMTG